VTIFASTVPMSICCMFLKTLGIVWTAVLNIADSHANTERKNPKGQEISWIMRRAGMGDLGRMM